MPDRQHSGKLLAAHSPRTGSKQTQPARFSTEHISIIALHKAPDIAMPAFEHSHDEYEFMLPLTPIPFLTREGAIYLGEVGFIYPAPSGKLHGIKYGLSDIAHQDIVIAKEYLDDMIAAQGMQGLEFNKPFLLSKYLRAYIDAFCHEYAQGEERDMGKLGHLSALICLELIEAGLRPNTDERREQTGYQKGLRLTAEFLHTNYQNDIAMAELVQMSGFSLNYFSSSFKKFFGHTPQAYLNKLRISQAKLLLENTGNTLGQIAALCGFKKANTFSTAFKTATGMTPREYRKSR